MKYHKDPFRAVNFPIGEDGIMRCPNGKNFYLQYRKNVKGNKYGRQEEVYQCEDCSGCPYAEQCKKTDKNRTVRINRELTAMHQEMCIRDRVTSTFTRTCLRMDMFLVESSPDTSSSASMHVQVMVS